MSEELMNKTESVPETKNTQSTPFQEIEPDCDIEETKDAYILTMDMPGMDPNKIQVDLDQDMLHISAMAEISGLEARHYERNFRVIRGLDAAKVSADYKQGVLALHLPKPAQQQSHQIKITAEA